MVNLEIGLRGEDKQKYVQSLYEDRPSRVMRWFGYALMMGAGISAGVILVTDPNLIALSLRGLLMTIGLSFAVMWRARQAPKAEIDDRPLAPMDVAEQSIRIRARIHRD